MTNAVLSFADVMRTYRHSEWGFTGTRAGMTATQYAWCKRAIDAGRPYVLSHGGAYGADTQVHAIRRDMRYSGVVEVWPADEKRQSMFRSQKYVNVHDVMDPLIRNEEIVRSSQFMFATPHTQHEIIRSGTWHTIRCAIKNAKPTFIIWPNGKLTLHRDKVLYRVA